MTQSNVDIPVELSPGVPGGSHVLFLGLCGIAFLAMAASLVGYGIFGERITVGLSEACAEAALDSGQKLEALGNTPQALQKYCQALKGNLADERARFQCGLAIGDILFRDQRYSEALVAYRALPESGFVTAGAFAGYVGTLWNVGDKEEALRLTLTWLALAEEEGNIEQEVWARRKLAQVAEEAGDEAASLTHYRRIAEIAPTDGMVIQMARVLARQGDVAGAQQVLEDFLNRTENPAHKKTARELRATLSPESNRVAGS